VTSIAAMRGFKGLSVYGATKGGLVSFSKSLARELGPVGITVNCVSPGFLETEMTSGLDGSQLEQIRRRTPIGELATVDDVAGAVAFLMSKSGKAMTGLKWTVDGGSTA
jgi:3-oxoacyl-[acyl-carrier protein] reductase